MEVLSFVTVICVVAFLSQELGEAQRLLEKIKSFEERTFQCLVFFAVGKVYLKENRYNSVEEMFFLIT